jgi:hypothetical protein
MMQEEEFEDTKGVIRMRKSKQDRQDNSKGVIRMRKSKQDRQDNSQKKNDKNNAEI